MHRATEYLLRWAMVSNMLNCLAPHLGPDRGHPSEHRVSKPLLSRPHAHRPSSPARCESLKDVGIPIDHARQIPSLAMPLSCHDAEPLAERVVPRQQEQGIRERSGVAGGEENPCLSVGYRLCHIAYVRRDHGNPSGQRLEDHHRQRLVRAGQHQHVTARQQPGNIVAVPEHAHSRRLCRGCAHRI